MIRANIGVLARSGGGGFSNPFTEFSGNILFSETFSGQSIDTNKWTVVNPNPTLVKISCDNSLFMESTMLGDALSLANYVEQTTAVNSLVYKFNLSSLFYNSVFTRIELWESATRYIRFERGVSVNTFNISLVYAGVTQYSLNAAVKAFDNVKIVTTDTDIKIYVFTTAGWTQIGVTQNLVYGALKFKFLANGSATARTKLAITDVYITDTDFATLNPVSEEHNARWWGAKGDGVTDDYAILQKYINSSQSVVRIEKGNYLISEALKIPSNKTVYFNNCRLVLANAKYDNLVRNKDFTGNTGITILGNNAVMFDQNATNNNDTANRTTWGKQQENSWRYLAVFMCNVSNFEIGKYMLYDYCGWGHLFQRCTGTSENHSSIHDVYIKTLTLIANQDGIDIGHGSSYIDISNINGKSNDDLIAVVDWGDGTFVNQDYTAGGTHHLTFNNINLAGEQISNGDLVAFLAGDGGYVRNISVAHGICNTTFNTCIMIYTKTYVTVPPVMADVSDITVDDILVTALGAIGNPAVLSLNEDCQNITLTNITNNSGRNLIYKEVSVNAQNIFINGTQYY